MIDIDFQPSGLASLRVVGQVERELPKAIAAVEQYMGVAVPPLTVVVAGRTGMATAKVLAAGWRRVTPRAVATYWLHTRREAQGALACTSVTRTDRIVIAVNSSALKRHEPGEVWSTLVHELVHAVQMDRPGRRAELRSGMDHDLRVTELPPGLRQAMDAVTAIEGAEAEAIQRALDPKAKPAPFDHSPAARRLLDAARRWETSVETIHAR